MTKGSALEELWRERVLLGGPHLTWPGSQAGNVSEQSELGPGEDKTKWCRL